MDPSTFYTLYRQTSIGITLADSIDQLICTNKVSPDLANSLMLHFDKAMAAHLTDNIKTNLVIKGKVDTYRYCDEVWTFVLENVYMKFSFGRNALEEMNMPGKVRVVACSSQRSLEDI